MRAVQRRRFANNTHFLTMLLLLCCVIGFLVGFVSHTSEDNQLGLMVQRYEVLTETEQQLRANISQLEEMHQRVDDLLSGRLTQTPSNPARNKQVNSHNSFTTLPSGFTYTPTPSPLPGNFKCTTNSGRCKFVLYVLPFKGFLGEQFSQQRLALMETMHFVKQLGEEYVLVEPLFVITPHNNTFIEALKKVTARPNINQERALLGRYLLPAGDVYDLTLMGKYFSNHNMGVMLWQDFLKKFKGDDDIIKMDLLMYDHGKNPYEPSFKYNCKTVDKLGKVEFLNELFDVHHAYCQEAIRAEGFPLTNARISAEQAANRSVKKPGIEYRTAFLAAHQLLAETLHFQDKKHVVIGHYLWRSLLSSKLYRWIEDVNLDYVDIKRHMLFSKAIWEDATQFVQEHLARPFVVMHIRRGDKLEVKDTYRTLNKAAERVTRVASHHDCKSAFLMTDMQNEDDIQFMNSSVKVTDGIKMYSNPKTREYTQEVQTMFKEMAIATMADFFIASDRAFWASTTPSRDIIEMRNIFFKYDKFTTYWFGRPGPRWSTPTIDKFTHSLDLLVD